MSAGQKEETAAPSLFQFSHVHFYADALRPLAHYQALQSRVNAFGEELVAEGGVAAGGCQAGLDVAKGRAIWQRLAGAAVTDDTAFVSQGQDIVEQLIVGAGWRIVTVSDTTGKGSGRGTRSFGLASSAKKGAQFIVSARGEAQASSSSSSSESAVKKLKTGDEDVAGSPYHLRASTIDHFYAQHNSRPGIGCLAFEVGPGDLARIAARYASKHPKLISQSVKTYPDGSQVLEVYAYYKGQSLVTDADTGTSLRFIESAGGPDGRADEAFYCVLPGMTSTAAADTVWGPTQLDFPGWCDHWVSNVVSREGFLQTLQDGLGFTPQVEFNAGVVAAGEARIESTVTGNKSGMKTTDPKFALTNMNQIYLPINNALSEVGHVHWFLEEIGQGVQHVATRVGDIIGFIQKVNDMRRMTNLGFSFLNIPRSYYGVLDDAALSNACGEGGAARAASIKSELLSAGVIDVNGIVVDLEVTDAAVQAASPGASAAVCAAVKHARYSNLHKLLGDNITSETYLAIVRNKILVDVQGEDLLYQIFTSNVLQREAGMESPFLEFIQRVCADGNKADGTCKVIRPGCGGFGIRNFLTLFLSIEVSKAMNDLEVSESKGDSVGKRFAERRITLFTDQLNESNPILTRISDAMTEEGVLREQAEEARAAGDLARASALAAEADKHMTIKDGGNGLLQECSGKYNGLMKALRQEHAEATAQ